MPLVQLGPFVFSSGWNPREIGGPTHRSYVVEHPTPNAEGGPVEYLGSQQPTYQLAGFLTNLGGQLSGAGAVISGWDGFVAHDADTAKDFLLGLRSGAQLLMIESTASPTGGIARWYENDFFFIRSMQFGYEAGRAYPYYPYSIELHRSNTSGRSYTESGSTATDMGAIAGNYISGYIYASYLSGIRPGGETLVGLGIFLRSAASGSIKLAIYNGNDDSRTVETRSQNVHSGWNYFSLLPTFTTVSGRHYWLAMKGNVNSTSGFTIGRGTVGTNAGFSRQSGTPYTDTFPATFAPGTLSGTQPWSLGIAMVV